jgi:TonB-linked SusC/RagA family outer membrane protein
MLQPLRPFQPPPSLRLVLQMVRAGLPLLALVAAAYSSALAQDSVSGRVVSTIDGAPLSGVIVAVGGTSHRTQTDGRGEYTLTVPAGARTLVFRSIGYRTLEVAIDGRTVIDVSLEAAALLLEPVVIGYTTQQRRDISGAVASVTTDAIEGRKVATVEEALKGRLAGVQIQSSGEPGQPAAIIVRGQTFLYNASPLYVVDGLYLRQNPNLNPNDIASIEVLKDASAASQYGAQAANGVVVITTKRGQAGQRTRVSLRSYYGFQEPTGRIEVKNARGWAEFAQQAYENARAQNPNADPVPQGVRDILAGTLTVDTDWQDAIVRRGAIQDHAFSMSGGSPTASYYLSGGYTRQAGTIRETAFDRYSFRINSESERGRLKVGENIALSRSFKNNLDLNEGQSPLIHAMRLPPGIPIYDPNNPTGFGFGSQYLPNFGTNPVGLLALIDNTRRTHQAIGTVFGEYELLKDLRYRLNLGVGYDDFEDRFFTRAGGMPRQNNPVDPAALNVGRDEQTSRLIENLLSFDRTIGNHTVNAVVGYTEQQTTRDFLWARRRNFPDENLQEIGAGVSELDNNGFQVNTRLRSYLARINYTLGSRYLATASFRRDGSSRFGPGNRWGNFAAGSLGWVVSEESFFPRIPLLGHAGFLKLRASYGTLGNQDFDDYQFAGLVALNQSYLFGNDVIAPGAIQVTLANPNIKWQNNTEQNYGIDLSLLGDRVSVTADYYISRSDDLLVRAPLPASLGSAASPFVNAGAVENRGFEFALTHRHSRGDFELRTTANLTTISNKVRSLGNNAQPIFSGGVSRTAVGYPIGHFWVYKMDGIFQSDAEVAAHGVQPDARPGDVRYADLNGDGVLNDQDRYNAGSPFPDFEGGFFLDGRFRGFDFSIGVRGSFGNEIFNEARWWMERMDDNSNVPKGLRPWTPENPSTTTPRALIGGLAASNARRESDRWVEDGSYLKLQNVQLGYTVPSTVFERLGIAMDRARVYLNLQNLYTLTKYTGFDPEFVGFSAGSLYTLERGVDFGRVYPNPRTITVGIELGF